MKLLMSDWLHRKSSLGLHVHGGHACFMAMRQTTFDECVKARGEVSPCREGSL